MLFREGTSNSEQPRTFRDFSRSYYSIFCIRRRALDGISRDRQKSKKNEITVLQENKTRFPNLPSAPAIHLLCASLSSYFIAIEIPPAGTEWKSTTDVGILGVTALHKSERKGRSKAGWKEERCRWLETEADRNRNSGRKRRRRCLPLNWTTKALSFSSRMSCVALKFNSSGGIRIKLFKTH